MNRRRDTTRLLNLIKVYSVKTGVAYIQKLKFYEANETLLWVTSRIIIG